MTAFSGDQNRVHKQTQKLQANKFFPRHAWFLVSFTDFAAAAFATVG